MTIACLRMNELALLQVYDLWWDHLTGFGVLGFEGPCSLHIVWRKHDTHRKAPAGAGPLAGPDRRQCSAAR